MKKTIFITLTLIGFFGLLQAQTPNKFRQLEQELPTPNTYRTASGAPGHEYYQQKADYKMKITLDDEQQRLYGEEIITYFNQSPDPLSYLWIQLDQNMRAKDSDTKKIGRGSFNDKMNIDELKRILNGYDGGFKIDFVKDNNGKPLSYTINKTMMRVDLPTELKPNGSFTFQIKWWYNINNRAEVGGRSGYEYFEEDSNYLYTIAQFFPRMAVYNDVEGWQNKQFLGRGEFALVFGDYEVDLTVPSNHVVTATGTLQNESAVLSTEQRNRLKKAQKSEVPVFIVNPEEALINEKSGNTKNTKTWKFKADNVRDFAFASSKKFIWDAMGVDLANKTVMAMSLYPKEGNPLWEKYSTKVVAHTLEVYSKFTFDYPYPVAISVHSNRIGMEYPMICFNGGRPEPDGTYSAATKHGMISVIIHEVGHNYFPMIVNSDERQWTWMDEGLNTFLQYLTEKEWDRDYPSRRGPAYKIVDYMKGDKLTISPIMTNSESIHQFGNNAYGKPATALNILRETIIGPELFDFAFKTYANRWMFKHPTPADFFRTMEDASAVDLDWFWRAWFYTTDHVDLSIDKVRYFSLDDKNPDNWQKEQESKFIGDIRNKERIPQSKVEADSSLRDFYNNYDFSKPQSIDREDYENYLSKFTAEEREMMGEEFHFYEITFSNIGGIPMPVILEFEFEDKSADLIHIPAEIWKMDDETITKVFHFEKKVTQITLDPNLETADVELNNNYFPRQRIESKFELYKSNARTRDNPMRRYDKQPLNK